MATEFPFDVVLRAKAAMQQGINEAMGQLKKFETDAFRAAGGGSNGGAMGGLLDGALKFGAAINLVKGGFSGLNAAISLARGDGEKFEQAMGRLPLGIGEAWRLGRELKATLADALDSGTRLAVEAKNAAEAYAVASKHNLDISRTFKDQGISIDRQLAILRAPEGMGRDLERLRQSNAAERLKLTQLGETGDDVSKREAAATIRKLNERENLEIAAIKKKYDDDKKKADETASQKQADEQEQFAKKLADQRDRVAQDELRAAGRHAEAQKMEIRRRYQGLRETANAEQKRLLEDLERRELGTVKPDEQAKVDRSRFSNAVLVSDRFRGHATQREDAGVAAVMRVENAVKDMGAKVQEAIRVGFRDLPRNLPGGILL